MIVVVASLLGIALFAWPFLGLAVPPATPALALALAAVGGMTALEAATRRLDSRRLALLAALSAVDTALRMAVITGIGGFNPFFFPILCAGFVIGPSFGFLTGAVSILVSAVATGGVGPWVPYQVFAAGWVGLAAGLAGTLARGPYGWRHVLALAGVGVVTGFAFGMAMDIWDWTAFYRGAPGFGWQPGLGAADALRRFATFYVATSAFYDSFRAAGNAVMVVVLGPPVLAALRRLRLRSSFEIVPVPNSV